MNKPLVSIIIVTWNTAKLTLECLTSIKNFLNNKNIEIIIVDNHSTDNTKELLSPLKYITYIQNKANFGFSKANNIGAAKANGDLLLFLNSDMLLIDNSLLNLISYYQSHPNIGIIGPQLLNYDQSPQASVFPDQSLINAFKEYWLKKSSSFSKFVPIQKTPISVWSLSGGAMLIDQSLFKKCGRWNEKYHFYFEDLDLCRSVKNLKKEIVYFPESKIIHYHGASGKNITDASNQWRRLIPGSLIYHGIVKHYLLTLILWVGQKFFK